MKRLLVAFALIPCGLLLAANNEAPAEKRANERVKFSLSAGAEYTDNRDGLPDKESSLDLYITPSLALDLKWEGTMMALMYAPTYRYRDNPNIVQNDSQLFHNLGLNFNHNPSRNVKLRLIEGFNVTDDPSIQKDGSTLRRDSSFILSQTEAGMNYAFSRLSNIDLSGRYMMRRYDDSLSSLESDLDKTEAGVTAWHQPGKRFALIGTAGYSKYGYAKYLGVDRGFDSIFAGVGVEEVFSPNVRCGIQGGLQSVSYNNDSVKSESSPYATASAQIAPIPSTRVTASISHMIRDAYQFPFTSQKMTDFGLRLDWETPGSELKLAFLVGYRVGDYNSDKIPADYLDNYQNDPTIQQYASASGFDSFGKEKTITAGAEIAYQIGLNTTIKLVQSYEDVNSSVRWSFKRNATNLALTRSF